MRALMLFVCGAAAACGAALSFELPDGTAKCPAQEVRATPGGGATLGSLNEGDNVKVTAINGLWYKVRLGDGTEGYVNSECLDVTVWAKVLDTGAWIHEAPSPSSKVLGRLGGLPYTHITGISRNWYEVQPSNSAAGWVEQTSIDAPVEFFTAWLALTRSPAPSQLADKQLYPAPLANETGGNTQPSAGAAGDASPRAGYSSLRSKVVSFAESFIGTPYVHGGASPAGFDCSGFTSYVFENFGIKISRSSSAQASVGEYVAPGDLLPGDLVLFSPGPGSKRVNHVGIYIGSGNFIQASSSKNGYYVRISPLFEGSYLHRFVTARRVIND